MVFINGQNKNKLLSLPMYPELSHEHVITIYNTINKFYQL